MQTLETQITELDTCLARARKSMRVLETRLARLRLSQLRTASHLSGQARKILALVCGDYALDPDEVLSRRRTRSIAEARQLTMALCAATSHMTQTQIARAWSRDHGTVSYAIQAIDDLRQTNPSFAERYTRLLKAAA